MLTKVRGVSWVSRKAIDRLDVSKLKSISKITRESACKLVVNVNEPELALTSTKRLTLSGEKGMK